jgi:DNA (cytosine-5)-methyltransferase 1
MFDYVADGNMTIFDFMYPTAKIGKSKIRLIELFGGVGSQAMALRNIGADFEHYKFVEYDKYPVMSYNAIHGTNFEPTDIRNVHGNDLGIVDTDQYCYIMTYSFPCQDLSVAGKMKGMTKGSGTRSGLLWEVERLLNETEFLPQVLLMENVPQVIADANIADFRLWQDFLESNGYTNYVEIINAKDQGVAQNRERAFMISILGQWNYKFPRPIPLTKTMADYLEDEVDEKYHIDSDKANQLIRDLINKDTLMLDVSQYKREGHPREYNDISPTLTARDWKDPRLIQVGMLDIKGDEQVRRVYSEDGLSPTLNTMQGGNRQPKVLVEGNTNPSGNGMNGNVFSINGLAPTLTTNKGEGNRILEPVIVTSRGRNKDNPSDRTLGADVEQRLEPNSEGICNTLTSVQKDNLVMEPTVRIKQATSEGYIECKLGGVADLSYPTSKTRRGRVQDNGDTCPTLTATETGVCRIETPYRIRKLTPLECWRLMGFTDEDFHKAEKVNSNTQLYKQAGNSIVCPVLENIFKQLL